MHMATVTQESKAPIIHTHIAYVPSLCTMSTQTESPDLIKHEHMAVFSSFDADGSGNVSLRQQRSCQACVGNT